MSKPGYFTDKKFGDPNFRKPVQKAPAKPTPAPRQNDPTQTFLNQIGVTPKGQGAGVLQPGARNPVPQKPTKPVIPINRETRNKIKQSGNEGAYQDSLASPFVTPQQSQEYYAKGPATKKIKVIDPIFGHTLKNDGYTSDPTMEDAQFLMEEHYRNLAEAADKNLKFSIFDFNKGLRYSRPGSESSIPSKDGKTQIPISAAIDQVANAFKVSRDRILTSKDPIHQFLNSMNMSTSGPARDRIKGESMDEGIGKLDKDTQSVTNFQRAMYEDAPGQVTDSDFQTYMRGAAAVVNPFNAPRMMSGQSRADAPAWVRMTESAGNLGFQMALPGTRAVAGAGMAARAATTIGKAVAYDLPQIQVMIKDAGGAIPAFTGLVDSVKKPFQSENSTPEEFFDAAMSAMMLFGLAHGIKAGTGKAVSWAKLGLHPKEAVATIGRYAEDVKQTFDGTDRKLVAETALRLQNEALAGKASEVYSDPKIADAAASIIVHASKRDYTMHGGDTAAVRVQDKLAMSHEVPGETNYNPPIVPEAPVGATENPVTSTASVKLGKPKASSEVPEIASQEINRKTVYKSDLPPIDTALFNEMVDYVDSGKGTPGDFYEERGFSRQAEHDFTEHWSWLKEERRTHQEDVKARKVNEVFKTDDLSKVSDEDLADAISTQEAITGASDSGWQKSVTGDIIKRDALPEHADNLAQLNRLKAEQAKRGLSSPEPKINEKIQTPQIETPPQDRATPKTKADPVAKPVEDKVSEGSQASAEGATQTPAPSKAQEVATPKTEEGGSPQQKEPWEMTKDEWEQSKMERITPNESDHPVQAALKMLAGNSVISKGMSHADFIKDGVRLNAISGRLESGQSVPPNVLKEYMELTGRDKYGLPPKGERGVWYSDQRQAEIEARLGRGTPVPAEVLKDYPDLKINEKIQAPQIETPPQINPDPVAKPVEDKVSEGSKAGASKVSEEVTPKKESQTASQLSEAKTRLEKELQDLRDSAKGRTEQPPAEWGERKKAKYLADNKDIMSRHANLVKKIEALDEQINAARAEEKIAWRNSEADRIVDGVKQGKFHPFWDKRTEEEMRGPLSERGIEIVDGYAQLKVSEGSQAGSEGATRTPAPQKPKEVAAPKVSQSDTVTGREGTYTIRELPPRDQFDGNKWGTVDGDGLTASSHPTKEKAIEHAQWLADGSGETKGAETRHGDFQVMPSNRDFMVTKWDGKDLLKENGIPKQFGKFKTQAEAIAEAKRLSEGSQAQEVAATKPKDAGSVTREEAEKYLPASVVADLKANDKKWSWIYTRAHFNAESQGVNVPKTVLNRDAKGIGRYSVELDGRPVEPWEITQKQAFLSQAEHLLNKNGNWHNWGLQEIPGIKDAHRKSVEKALSEGKPVPAEVLADYPDLAQKPLNQSPKSTKKGTYLWDEATQKGILTLNKNADASTVIHELQHHFLQTASGQTKANIASWALKQPTTPEQAEKIMAEGSKNPRYVRIQESFAYATEQSLKGKSQVPPDIQEAMDAYRGYLGSVKEAFVPDEVNLNQGLEQSNPQTKTPEFKKWFGESKVVDEKGEPLVVYHGTPDVFQAFSTSEARTQYTKKGFFFTDSPEVAATYFDSPNQAERVKRRELQSVYSKYLELTKKYDVGTPMADIGHYKWLDYATNHIEQAGLPPAVAKELKTVADRVDTLAYEPMEAPQSTNGNVIPAHLSLKNPKIINAENLPYWDLVNEQVITNAVKEGRDGVIIKNIIDTGDGSDLKSNVYMVFEPTQIKSAIANSGKFDPQNPSILHQNPKGKTKLTPHDADFDKLMGEILGGAITADHSKAFAREVGRAAPSPKQGKSTANESTQEGQNYSTQEEVSKLRERFGIKQYEKNPETVEGWFNESKAKGYHEPDNASDLAVALEVDGKTANNVETTGLAVALAKIDDQLKALAEGPNTPESFAKEDRLRAMGESIAATLDKSGSEWGREGVARKLLIKNDYSYAGLQRKAAKYGVEADVNKEKFLELSDIIETETAKLKGEDPTPTTRETADSVIKTAESDAIQTSRKKQSPEAKAKAKETSEARKAALIAHIRELTDSNELFQKDPAEMGASESIKELAIMHVKDGARGLESVVKRVQDDLPHLDAQEIIDAIGERGEPKTLSELQKAIAELKREAVKASTEGKAAAEDRKLQSEKKKVESRVDTLNKQIADIEKQLAANKFPDPRKRTGSTDPVIRNLEAKLKILRKAKREAIAKLPESVQKKTDARIKSINKQIEAYELKIKNKDFADPAKKPAPTDPAEIAAKARLSEAGKKFRLFKKEPWRAEADVESRFKIYTAKAEAHRILEKAKRKADLQEKDIVDKSLDITQNAIDKSQAVSGGMVSTFDDSGVFRQGGDAFWQILLSKNFRNAFTPMKKGFKSMPSKMGEYAVADEYMQHPYYDESVADGVDYTGVMGKSHEEQVVGLHAIPKIGDKIAFSERAFSTTGNAYRFELYKQLRDAISPKTAADRKLIAEFVNISTGRAVVNSRLAKIVLKLPGMWAPRWLMSRAQVLHVLRGNASWRVKRGVALSELKAIAGPLMVMGLLKTMGAKVTDDYDDPDFGKIVIGKLHIDMTAGRANLLRHVLQQLSTLKKWANNPNAPSWGKDSPAEELLTRAAHFYRIKLNPLAQSAANLGTGQDVLGNPYKSSITPFGRAVVDAFTPLGARLGYQESMEAKEGKISSAELGVSVLLDIFGIGTQTYEPRVFNKDPNAKLSSAEIQSKAEWNKQRKEREAFTSIPLLERTFSKS